MGGGFPWWFVKTRVFTVNNHIDHFDTEDDGDVKDFQLAPPLYVMIIMMMMMMTTSMTTATMTLTMITMSNIFTQLSLHLLYIASENSHPSPQSSEHPPLHAVQPSAVQQQCNATKFNATKSTLLCNKMQSKKRHPPLHKVHDNSKKLWTSMR